MTTLLIDLLLGIMRGAGIIPRPPKEPTRYRYVAPPTRHHAAPNYVPEWAEPLEPKS